MRRISILCSALSLLLLATLAPAQTPAWQWGLQTTNPAPTDDSRIFPNALATDAAGNVYVGGEYAAGSGAPSLRRDFGSAGSVGPDAGGYVAQVTPAGQWAWLTPVTTTPLGSGIGHAAEVTGVTVAPAGEVYVSGYARGASVVIGGQSQALGSAGGGLFVARLSSAGQCQWLRTVPASSTRPALALDPSTGGVVLAGAYNDALSFGSTVLPLAGAWNEQNIYVARLSAAGQWLAAAAATSTTDFFPSLEVAVGPAGQVAVLGSHSAGELEFGPLRLATPVGADEAWLVAQLGPNNRWDWAFSDPAHATSAVIGGAYTAGGELWVGGRGKAGTVLGTTTLAPPAGPGGNSFAGFLARLSATGQWQAVHLLQPTTPSTAALLEPRLDAAGNVVVLGVVGGRPAAVQASLGGYGVACPAGERQVFVAQLDRTGQWHAPTLVPRPARALGFEPTHPALDTQANLYLAGSLRGSLTVGGSTLQGSPGGATSFATGGDVVVTKLAHATALPTRPAAAPAPALAVFPSPAHGRAVLRLPMPAATARPLAVFDALGRPVRALTVPAQATEVPLDLTGLASGLYLLRAGAATGRLVVE